jgi:hypothetical protein
MKLPLEKKPGLPRPTTNLKGHLIWLGVASGLIAIYPAAMAATLQVKPGGAGGAYPQSALPSCEHRRTTLTAEPWTSSK